MPWSDYPADVRQFSGFIQAAAEARFGSAATVQLIAQAARDAGLSLSFQSFAGISRAYGAFVDVREARASLADAADTLERTGLDQGITAAMVANPPWSPSFSATSGAQFVLVRGLYSQETPEGTISGYFSHRYTLAEVHTVGQVMTDMQAQMEQNAGGTDLQGAQLQSIAGIEWSTA